MKKDYIQELRDNIALAVLPVLLSKCQHLEFSDITNLSYQLADEMLKARNKQKSIFNHIKE